MSLIWIFQLALDIAVVAILARYFLSKRGGILALREKIARELAKSQQNIDTPLGSALSTLAEKKQKLYEPSMNSTMTSMKVALQMDTDSSLFGGQSNLKVIEAKRLINQGLGKREIAQRTGLSHAELSLLEKTMLGGLKNQE